MARGASDAVRRVVAGRARGFGPAIVRPAAQHPAAGMNEPIGKESEMTGKMIVRWLAAGTIAIASIATAYADSPRRSAKSPTATSLAKSRPQHARRGQRNSGRKRSKRSGVRDTRSAAAGKRIDSARSRP